MPARDALLSVTAALVDAYAGSRWLIGTDVLQAASGTVARLQAWGADACLVVAARQGTGVPPECAHVVLDLPVAPDMMAGIRRSEEALRALPEDVSSTIDAFDPSGQARVLMSIFSDDRPVAGRAVFGGRPAAWRALEDKVVVDELWDACGVPRAPSVVVPASLEALAAAAAQLDEGNGTVWAADASQGFHGGGAHTIPVRSRQEAAAAAARLAAVAKTVRVMPYLRGVPCSIHGIVMDEHVVALRPVEMLTMLGPRGFVYGRASTLWDPPAVGRAQMREVARTVGEYLRRTVAFRGAFTVDGVYGPSGFRPTELNPRVGAALALMHAGVAFDLLNHVLIEGWRIDVDPGELERTLLTHADNHRRAAASLRFDRPIEETNTFPLAWSGTAWVSHVGDAEPDATAVVGPGSTGAMAFLRVKSERLPVGMSFSQRLVAFADWLDAAFDAGIGPVQSTE